jgi:hypothetical protein
MQYANYQHINTCIYIFLAVSYIFFTFAALFKIIY